MNGIDCTTRLTTANAQALKQTGIDAVGRYLGNGLGLAKAITPDEVKAIHGAGLSIFLIWELSPTKRSYFSYSKGISDAAAAIAEAVALGVPSGVAIYFTVDYDAQSGDMTAIVDYLHGVKDGLGGKYLIGLYGSYAVMQNVSVDRYFQTYAWSGGKKANCHIYQHTNNVHVGGVAVDQDYVNDDAGLWGAMKMFKDLIIYADGADKRAAEYLADALKAPIVSVDNVTPELLACATTKYKVGGSVYAGATLVAGDNRFSTMAAVLKLVGEI